MTDSVTVNQPDMSNLPENSPGHFRKRPGPVHQQLYNQIVDDIMEQVKTMLPTFGTVTGMQGGKVLVQVDGEVAPRAVGLTRKKGQRYKPGEVVKVGKSRDGSEYVDGTFSSKDGSDPAVDFQDIFDKAIKNGHLDNGAVDGGKIKNNEIADRHLTPALSGRIDDAKKAGDNAQKTADNANTDIGKINSAIGSNQQNGTIRGDIKANSDKVDNLQNRVFGGGGENNTIVDRIQNVQDKIPDVSGIKSDINTMKADIQKLKDDVKKLKSSGSNN